MLHVSYRPDVLQDWYESHLFGFVADSETDT